MMRADPVILDTPGLHQPENQPENSYPLAGGPVPKLRRAVGRDRWRLLPLYCLLFLLGAAADIAYQWRSLTTPDLLAPPNDPASWQLYAGGGAQSLLRRDGTTLRLDIGPTDGVSAHVKFFQRGINLQEGHAYTLRFRARADALRDMGVEACLDQPDYHNVGLKRVAPLLPEWQGFSETFVATHVLANDTDVPRFMVGDKAGTIWLADVSVTEAKP